MDRTLYQDIQDREASTLILQIFADLEFLGVIKKYGTHCLFINTLLQRILSYEGYRVEIRTCNAIIDRENKRFFLGSKEFTLQHQLATHVVCILDETFLIDFGLGNVRKGFDPDFVQAISLQIKPIADSLGEIRIGESTLLSYVAETPPDDFLLRQQVQEPILLKTLEVYRRYKQNRFKYALSKALRKMGLSSRLSRRQEAEALRKVSARFDDTLYQ